MYHILITFLLPYAITTHYNKINVLIFDLQNIWISCDYLIFRRYFCIILVLQITQSSRQVQVTIYTTVLDLTSCFVYAFCLFLVFRLVVLAQGISFLPNWRNWSRITCICTVNVLRGYQNDICCTSCMRNFFIAYSILFLFHLILNIDNLIFAFFCKKKLVNFEECFLQCFFIFAFLEILVWL